jgi:hypothetical protein
MPAWPATFSNPGLLLALCLIVGLVIGVNASLLALFRRGSGREQESQWSRALGGDRERRQQQAAQLAELHRAVTQLTAGKPDSEKPGG